MPLARTRAMLDAYRREPRSTAVLQGFRALEFRVLEFRVLEFRVLEFRALEFRV